MKTLLIMRHAKSSWDDPDQPDHDRPLNKRGKCDAPQMGQLLREQNLVPELIITSTAARARKTAKRVAQSCGYDQEIVKRPELYQGGIESYVQALRELGDPAEHILIIGHNPDLSEWLEMLTGQLTTFPTAAIAQVKLDVTTWSELTAATPGRIQNLWRPKELPQTDSSVDHSN